MRREAIYPLDGRYLVSIIDGDLVSPNISPRTFQDTPTYRRAHVVSQCLDPTTLLSQKSGRFQFGRYRPLLQTKPVKCFRFDAKYVRDAYSFRIWIARTLWGAKRQPPHSCMIAPPAAMIHCMPPNDKTPQGKYIGKPDHSGYPPPILCHQ